MQSFDVIAAISTPYGRGGISVIRISGEGALSVASRVFFPKNGRLLSDIPGGTTTYGKIVWSGRHIDDGIAAVFRSPHSYTGEDTVEISCHGGIKITETVLSAVLDAGSRLAEGGEFTKRAFLNGKLSLTEAEAVIGLIDAKTDEQLRLSAAMTGGVLHRKIRELSERLTDLIASVYAYIDYPEEDLTDMTSIELYEKLSILFSDTLSLSETYRAGHAVGEGVRTVIVGKPNVGKSSLLNRMIGYERAIVTDIAGTTRDTVEESINVGSVVLRLCDTAGLRHTDDPIEKLGVMRTMEKLAQAELVLAVFDSSRPWDDDDRRLLKLLVEYDGEVLVILNKCDCGVLPFAEELIDYSPIILSSVTGEGFDHLKKRISELYVSERINYDNTPVIANARQHAALLGAVEHLSAALKTLENGFTQDVAGMDLELALGKLQELDGRGLSEAITDRIFSRFCVGK